MSAVFKLFHKSGLQVEFNLDGSIHPIEFIAGVTSGIDSALSSDWSVNEPEKILGPTKTYEINGWVYGLSAKQSLPVVWLYSPVSPEHKVAQVYSEKIDTLPLGVNLEETQAYPGGLAPKKSIASKSGWFHACDPFSVLLEDTGETFEGHSIYRFVRVLSTDQPAASAQPASPQPTSAQPTGNAQPAHKHAAREVLEASIKRIFGDTDYGVALGTPWLLAQWSGRNTDNPRNKIDTFSEAELVKIDQNLMAYEKVVKSKFDVWVESEKQAAAQAKQAIGTLTEDDIPFDSDPDDVPY